MFLRNEVICFAWSYVLRTPNVFERQMYRPINSSAESR